MKLVADPRSIGDTLKLDRKYVIPRFQREYSWKNDQLEAIWNDLLDNIRLDGKSIFPQEYFLGSLVLVGDEDNSSDIKRFVVDGQQRLMTFTIAFAVFTQLFAQIGEEGLSEATYSYIMAKDNNGKEYAKLVAETKKPFFQSRIQDKKPDMTLAPKTKEEQRILDAYKFFENHLKEENLFSDFEKKFPDIKKEIKYVDLLRTIRDQILTCKVIYVVVKDMEDAYTIFEVLNAKGMPLTALDIIKNYIFSILNKEEPLDFASEKWKIIKKNVTPSDKDEELLTFYRHFWLSKYDLVTEKYLVKSFRNKIQSNESSYKEFINVLEIESQQYGKIIHPSENDWRQPEDLDVYIALNALNVFKTKQVRTFLLALFSLKKEKNINHKYYIKILKSLERFHFIFTAVCSSRASGLESKYSTYARKLRACKNDTDVTNCNNELINWTNTILPPYELFEKKIFTIKYASSEQKNKKLVQYILRKLETYFSQTNELKPASFTIEHIVPESTRLDCVGIIGNLLPLGNELNSNAQNDDFRSKIPYYNKSQYASVMTFMSEYSGKENFADEDINNRTCALSKILYSEMWER
jgi:uncharacterized protein with ParB-like and HNH nuclease domain